MRKRVMPLADLELPQLVAAVSLCDGFVAASTGPLHIAAIVARSAVGLLSEVQDQHPNRWLPVGPNCTILSASANYPDPPPVGSPMADLHMSQITVEMVVERVGQSLAQCRAA
jgi:ADP-heptose:LPS heptosyltransferase